MRGRGAAAPLVVLLACLACAGGGVGAGTEVADLDATAVEIAGTEVTNPADTGGDGPAPSDVAEGDGGEGPAPSDVAEGDGGEGPEVEDAESAEAETVEPPLLSQARFAQVVAQGDEAGLDAFLEAYDMPICEAGACLFVTVIEWVGAVEVRGSFDGWAPGHDLARVPFRGQVWQGTIPMSVEPVVEYKLVVDGQWRVDGTNRYFRWADFGPNSAIYAPGVGRLTALHEVWSPELGYTRSVYVYLPAAYFGGASDARFPVLYLQDGFNVFENPRAPFGTWDVEQTADALMASGQAQPAIFVAVDTPDRFSEYLHTATTIHLDGSTYTVDPKLPDYATFLVQTLKPLIDQTFRTRPEREAAAMAGSSLGGLSSLWTAWHHPGVFGHVASLSGSFWVGEAALGDEGPGPTMREILADTDGDALPHGLRIYLDAGDTTFAGEASYRADAWVGTDWVRNALIRMGWDNRPEWDPDGDLATAPLDLDPDTPIDQVPHLSWAAQPPAPYTGWADYLGTDRDLVCLTGHGHPHNEAAWKARFPAVLTYLFPGPAL